MKCVVAWALKYVRCDLAPFFLESPFLKFFLHPCACQFSFCYMISFESRVLQLIYVLPASFVLLNQFVLFCMQDYPSIFQMEQALVKNFVVPVFTLRSSRLSQLRVERNLVSARCRFQVFFRFILNPPSIQFNFIVV